MEANLNDYFRAGDWCRGVQNKDWIAKAWRLLRIHTSKVRIIVTIRKQRWKSLTIKSHSSEWHRDCLGKYRSFEGRCNC